jgi:hypothetical protein
MLYDDDKDAVFTDTDLKALLLKSMPLSWQNAYLLKGTCISDDFWQCSLTLYSFRVLQTTKQA